ncbi:MAG: hypothetical protein ACM3VZ_07760 [Acidobacteriota bacterium]
MARFPFSISLRAVAAAAALVCIPVAQAEPLSLTASHTVARDSNFARTETPISDTINTTALQLDLDKQYGRQTYTGMAKVAAVRFNNYGDLLNNDEKDLALGFSTELMSNWRVMLNGAYGEDLNQFENNRITNHLVKNVRTTKSALAQVVYGVSGIWAVVGSAGKNTLGYSAPEYSVLEYRQDSQGLKAIYYTSDLLSYNLGVRKVETQFPGQNDRVHETDLDLGADWVITGLSKLGATISWTKNRRDLQKDRHFDGFTGRLNWNYTPHGLMSYGISAYKTSNTDQYVVENGLLTALNIPGQVSFNNRVTSVSAFARWDATAKLALTASTTWSHYNVDNDYIFSTTRDASDYHLYSMSAHYAVERWLKLSAGVSSYSQTKDATRNKYSGHTVNVSASFILD